MHYQQAKSFLCHNGNPCAFFSSTFEGYFESRHKEIFKLLLLHSNSQLANLLSSPAKNASWGSTPITFHCIWQNKSLFSDTQKGVCRSLRSRKSHITERPICCQVFRTQPCVYLTESYISNSSLRAKAVPSVWDDVCTLSTYCQL